MNIEAKLALRLQFLTRVMRTLRNQMVHEYVEDVVILTSALQSGHAFVATLVTAGEKMSAEIARKGWLGA